MFTQHINVVARPTAEVVSLAEAKAFLRVDGDAEDTLIENLINAATQWLEEHTGRAFLLQKLRLNVSKSPINVSQSWLGGDWACRMIKLPKPPFIALDNPPERVNVTTDVRTRERNFRILNGPILHKFQLATPLRVDEQVIISYTCGYGENPKDVPETLRTCILMIVAEWFESRGQLVSSSQNVSSVVLAIADQYCVKNIC